jgi:hypothetical protein
MLPSHTDTDIMIEHVGSRTIFVEGLEAELEDYEIKEKVLPQFAYIDNWSEFDLQFGPNLNKMYLELEVF